MKQVQQAGAPHPASRDTRSPLASLARKKSEFRPKSRQDRVQIPQEAQKLGSIFGFHAHFRHWPHPRFAFFEFYLPSTPDRTYDFVVFFEPNRRQPTPQAATQKSEPDSIAPHLVLRQHPERELRPKRYGQLQPLVYPSWTTVASPWCRPPDRGPKLHDNGVSRHHGHRGDIPPNPANRDATKRRP